MSQQIAMQKLRTAYEDWRRANSSKSITRIRDAKATLVSVARKYGSKLGGRAGRLCFAVQDWKAMFEKPACFSRRGSDVAVAIESVIRAGRDLS